MRVLILLGGLAGCSSGGNAQLPPVGQAQIEPWLTAGDYRNWRCETAMHAPRSPSPHGNSRVCSNNLTSGGRSGEYPLGSASVIELGDANNAVIGYAVSLHVRAGSAADTWYWYARSSQGTFVDGAGNMQAPMSMCNGCHSQTGVSPYTGHDYVFTQVP